MQLKDGLKLAPTSLHDHEDRDDGDNRQHDAGDPQRPFIIPYRGHVEEEINHADQHEHADRRTVPSGPSSSGPGGTRRPFTLRQLGQLRAGDIDQQRLPPDLACRAVEALREAVHDETALEHVHRRDRRPAKLRETAARLPAQRLGQPGIGRRREPADCASLSLVQVPLERAMMNASFGRVLAKVPKFSTQGLSTNRASARGTSIRRESRAPRVCRCPWDSA